MKIKNAEAFITKGLITIQVRVTDLPAIISYSYDMGVIDERVEIVNSKEFAKEVVLALNDENETGDTLVHQMLDHAFNKAINLGAEGVKCLADEED